MDMLSAWLVAGVLCMAMLNTQLASVTGTGWSYFANLVLCGTNTMAV